MKKIIYYTQAFNNLETAVPEALKILGWRSKKDENVHIIKFPTSFLTWGAIMKIDIVNSKQCNIEIKHKLPTTIIDWGFSVNKIDQLIREIQVLGKDIENL